MRRRAPSPLTVFAIASLGVLMAFVDATIVNIAFPDIAKTLPDSSISRVHSDPGAAAGSRMQSAGGRLAGGQPAGATMASLGEGPNIAVDVKATFERSRANGSRQVRTPSLGETLTRVLLLGSSNTSESARLHADLMIKPRADGVGLLEFHQLDVARESGRAAAREVLEAGAHELA
jgi:hypothetical protein